MSGQSMAEAIRLELRKGSYQMPGDTLPYETQAATIAAALSAAGFGPVQEASGYLIVQPDGAGLDFVDWTTVIMPTIEEARKDLAEWYGDTPGASIYRLVKEDQP